MRRWWFDYSGLWVRFLFPSSFADFSQLLGWMLRGRDCVPKNGLREKRC
jgi:hypothetical protein